MKKKIGILTFHNAINYGAVLQAYALQTYINNNYEADCSIIDYDNNYFKYIYNYNVWQNGISLKTRIKRLIQLLYHPIKTHKDKVKRKTLLRFINKYFILNYKCDRTDFNKATSVVDKIIVGSDQVWNMSLSNFDTTYFLDCVEDDSKKYSYAASLGKGTITGFEYENMKEYLPKFQKICVREDVGQKVLEDFIGVKSNVTLDPTLLLNKEDWSKLIPNKKTEKFILIYMIQEQTNLLECAEKYAKENDCDIYSLNYIQGKKYKLLTDKGIEDFLYYINNADCIFTTSFHGMIFSINFNKRFFYELSKKPVNNNSRLESVAFKLGLEDREIKTNNLTYSEIDYSSVNEKLNKLRNESISHLTSIIKE